jgi:hypothetical protein
MDLSPLDNPSLASFRRTTTEVSTEHELPAVFVLEPHMWRTAGVVASWRPRAVVQTMDAFSLASSRLAANVEHALSTLRATAVVLCAEGTTTPPNARGAARLLEVRAALAEDPILGARVRTRALPIEALWFDLSEGDVYRWEPDARAFRLLSDQGLARFSSSLRASTSRSPESGEA